MHPVRACQRPHGRPGPRRHATAAPSQAERLRRRPARAAAYGSHPARFPRHPWHASSPDETGPAPRPGHPAAAPAPCGTHCPRHFAHGLARSDSDRARQRPGRRAAAAARYGIAPSRRHPRHPPHAAAEHGSHLTDPSRPGPATVVRRRPRHPAYAAAQSGSHPVCRCLPAALPGTAPLHGCRRHLADAAAQHRNHLAHPCRPADATAPADIAPPSRRPRHLADAAAHYGNHLAPRCRPADAAARYGSARSRRRPRHSGHAAAQHGSPFGRRHRPADPATLPGTAPSHGCRRRLAPHELARCGSAQPRRRPRHLAYGPARQGTGPVPHRSRHPRKVAAARDARPVAHPAPAPRRHHHPARSPAAGHPVPRCCPGHAWGGTAALQPRRGLPNPPRHHAIARRHADAHSPACGLAANLQHPRDRLRTPSVPRRPHHAQHFRHPANPAALLTKPTTLGARPVPGSQGSARNHAPRHPPCAVRTPHPPRLPPPLPSRATATAPASAGG